MLLSGSVTSLEEQDQRCYDKYGCFNNYAPFDRSYTYGLLPERPEDIQTTFHLFTTRNRFSGTILDDSNVKKLKSSYYEGLKKTVLIIHGFTGKYFDNPEKNCMMN